MASASVTITEEPRRALGSCRGPAREGATRAAASRLLLGQSRLALPAPLLRNRVYQKERLLLLSFDTPAL
jgi:hypothetical protein